MRLSRLILYFLTGVFLAQLFYYYPALPETVATHFNAAGEPNDWMSKRNFAIFEVALLAFIIFEFTLLPYLVEKMPDSLLNLPNKDYWLAPERRAEAFVMFRQSFEQFGALLLGLFIVVNQLVYRANLTRTNLPSTEMWLIIGTFLVFTVLWMIKFMRQFKIKK